jgi:hypothetical protein
MDAHDFAERPKLIARGAKSIPISAADTFTCRSESETQLVLFFLGRSERRHVLFIRQLSEKVGVSLKCTVPTMDTEIDCLEELIGGRAVPIETVSERLLVFISCGTISDDYGDSIQQRRKPLPEFLEKLTQRLASFHRSKVNMRTDRTCMDLVDHAARVRRKCSGITCLAHRP